MSNKRIIVNGVFDILHTGHLDLFEKAKHLGGYLLVLVDSDERVKKHKGANRPINTLKDRIRMLEAIRFIDGVEPFDSNEQFYQILQGYLPDIMVKGSEYRNQPILGSHLIPEIHFIDRTDDSSTEKIQRLGLG